ncbi:uncharacterized protein LOC131214783 [Anopheles bellator]|uniref:uncharacterized protein LOC131214782 n=1 Tax=Anopheles bellator TaxID=139047 RepID=UPI002648E291|nr:uncharacterized protein LOC131214782 [Anopheles bellator]XP_058065098.1 uncharacterized protein LOC131214783 [Anopheles bellator]
MARSHSADMVSLESSTVSVPTTASTISSPATFTDVSPTLLAAGVGTAATPSVQFPSDHEQYLLQQQRLQQQLNDGKIVQQAKEFLLAQQHLQIRGCGDTVAAGGGSSSSPGQPDDAGSTDSSIFDEDIKRRRRKLHFPFGKRFSKSKKQ